MQERGRFSAVVEIVTVVLIYDDGKEQHFDGAAARAVKLRPADRPNAIPIYELLMRFIESRGGPLSIGAEKGLAVAAQFGTAHLQSSLTETFEDLVVNDAQIDSNVVAAKIDYLITISRHADG